MNDKTNKIIEAIDKFNERHRKYSICYFTDENYFKFNIVDKKDKYKTVIKFNISINGLESIDEIIEILEDLRKDLTGKK